MKAENYVHILKEFGFDTLIGVPDSTLKQFCDYINTDGKNEFFHYVPANEGAATGLAAGTYLATGKPACVYMQNSGIGNIVNPLTSIANKEVYGIPMLFMVGWRGEPGVHDEPQHRFMGRITETIFDTLEVPHSVIDSNTTEEELKAILNEAKKVLDDCRQYALIVKKGTFEKRSGGTYENAYALNREEAIRTILTHVKENDLIVSTTGKISREVYEQSDIVLGGHTKSFLTVGGMGHASMIAYGIAVKRNDKHVICMDGDGAVMMHMGSLAFIGQNKPERFTHILLNNDSHESVGGMPTGASGMQYAGIAEKCGYDCVKTVRTEEELTKALDEIWDADGVSFLEVLVSLGSRDDLGRPKEPAEENKISFMKNME
ncbi:MAG: phosphonopyruvate decarboxylase [Solobacterium sp.]|nr:phosphonopyruvate decarboxylase [Solobacterium sp.]